MAKNLPILTLQESLEELIEWKNLKIDNTLNWEFKLIDSLDFNNYKFVGEIKNDYDFVIIDCSPSLGLITVNALVAADSVIIPVQTEFFALEGLRSRSGNFMSLK